MSELPTIDEVYDAFALIDDWEERYAYLIELGRALPPLADAERTEENRVRGCVSQVWLVHDAEEREDGRRTLVFRGDSDAMIVKGLVAVVLGLMNHKTPAEIATLDVEKALAPLDLGAHLTPQRSNGLAAMVKRMKAEAAAAMAEG